MVFSANDFVKLCEMISTYLSDLNKGEWIIEGHGKFSNYLKYKPSQSNTFQIQVSIFYQSEDEQIIVIVGQLGTISSINWSFEQRGTKKFNILSYGNEPLRGLTANIVDFADRYIKKISNEILKEFYKKAA